ncbi:DUF3800 domain-containing protein [Sinorhizobium fredii]|uniref:DUF3800 domain-containing protein n=1 Tax=Rhizobium fredii TaxID=380 RepID=UPI001FCA59EA|nr:DUF3800 domain-containing protein [Sinorhizobium fredii]
MEHLIFFMDDFGTRTMCKPGVEQPLPLNEFSFGLGGIIVPSESVGELSDAVLAFCERWDVPELHGNKIRGRKGKFGFLKTDDDARERFFSELDGLISDPRITAHGCVICRLGYRDRYLEKHPVASRWQMSRTAFDISVERAAKYARTIGRQMSVVYERTGKAEDRLIGSYFKGLLAAGTEFDAQTSAVHAPLSPSELAETLGTIWPDGKNNPMLQLADLVLHPLCNQPTKRPDRAYERLLATQQIIDFKSDDPTIAVKYSCYDGSYQEWVQPTNT